MKTYKQFIAEGSLWDYMYKKNKSVFYRGQSSSGKGMGFGMLGLGIYLTWSESMAQQFAKKQTRGVVQSFKVKRGLKMADNYIEYEYGSWKEDKKDYKYKTRPHDEWDEILKGNDYY